VDDIDERSLVNAEFSIGLHPAIVLSTKEEIEADGMVRVVGISANTTISLPEDRIPVPPGLGLHKKCYVQCEVLETLPLSKVKSRHRKVWGAFYQDIQKQVKVVIERRKKASKQS
jgi:mRNA-degrading endonuclease toxin of MazEF toxin-antitoxin module